MKRPIFSLFALLAGSSAFAAGSTAMTTVNGAGLQILGTASQTVGEKTLTVSIGNTPTVNPVTAIPGGTGNGVTDAGTFAASLSVGNTLGGGAGSTGGIAGTQTGN